MNRAEVVAHARKLMNQYGLGGVPFQLSKTKRAIARCRFRSGKVWCIEFSELFIPVLSDERIDKIIKHEIAHALAGAAAGHGYAWKRKARELGIKPDRCESLTPEENRAFGERHANYRATCSCPSGKHVEYFSRMGKAWKQGRYRCPSGKRFTVETIR